jgi:hypothetical protein
LLAHELAHVVQQTAPEAQLARNSPVTAQQAEAEAGRAADMMVNGGPMPALSRASGPARQSRAPGAEETASPDMQVIELYPIKPEAENKGFVPNIERYNENAWR